jgi:hypothetical protein
VAAAVLLVAAASAARPPLRDAPPVWYHDDTAPIPVPEVWDPDLLITDIDALVSQPVARIIDPVRWVGAVPPAQNVNALDEVPSSSWFTNRMGVRRLSRAELAAGPDPRGPDRSGPWEIIGAKTDGVTPGFRIRDAAGAVWLLKFDPPQHPGQSIRAGAVSNLILHAIGYHVPVDKLVVFTRDQLRVGTGGRLRGVRGQDSVALTPANLDSVLQATRSVFGGRYHALASRYLDGRPLGPIRATGTRPDDPNDVIPHQHRREWRALQVFGAWIGHNDTKVQNSLAMYVGEPGQGHVRHHLLDFASTLGSSGAQLFPKFNYEHGVDARAIGRRLVTLGLSRDPWRLIDWPDHLAEVGYFSAERFDPCAWRPITPHAAMANLDDRDGYWAAKIVSAFTDADLRFMVEQGRYQDPGAVDYLVEHLGRRRDVIARTWFDRIAPLDHFRRAGDRLRGEDLGVARGVYPAEGVRYRWRARPVDAGRQGGAWTAWVVTDAPELDLDLTPWAACDAEQPFLAVAWEVDRGDGWQGPATVYLAAAGSGRIVALDH